MTEENVHQQFYTAIMIIPCFTGFISLVSSIYMGTSIWNGGGASSSSSSSSSSQQRNRPRDQLLLGLCFLDACGSFGFLFSTFAGPRDVPTRYYKHYGSVATCAAQGFFEQLGLGVPLYNAALCIYYILVVRYHVSNERLSKWMVPVAHVLILGFILTSAIIGLVLKVFNTAGAMGCWANNVGEEQCETNPALCGRGDWDIVNTFINRFGFPHIAFAGAVVTVSMIVLYCTVRGIENRAARWNPVERYARDDSTTNNVSDSARNTTTSINNDSNSNVLSESQRTSHRSSQRNLRRQERQKKNKMSKQTMETGVLYSASFLLVYLPSLLLILGVFTIKSTEYFLLSIANAVFLPSQGFFNMLIYTSPKWRPWLKKKTDKMMMMWWSKVCCCCCRKDGSEATSPSVRRPAGNSNNTAISEGEFHHHHHHHDDEQVDLEHGRNNNVVLVVESEQEIVFAKDSQIDNSMRIEEEEEEETEEEEENASADDHQQQTIVEEEEERIANESEDVGKNATPVSTTNGGGSTIEEMPTDSSSEVISVGATKTTAPQLDNDDDNQDYAIPESTWSAAFALPPVSEYNNYPETVPTTTMDGRRRRRSLLHPETGGGERPRRRSHVLTQEDILAHDGFSDNNQRTTRPARRRSLLSKDELEVLQGLTSTEFRL